MSSAADLAAIAACGVLLARSVVLVRREGGGGGGGDVESGGPPRESAVSRTGPYGCGAHADVTVILTTSPTPSNPSTRLLEIVLRSVVRHEPSLQHCPKVIVCDGFILAPPTRTGRIRFKSGKVTHSHAEAYDEYKARLRDLVAAGDPHRGFANSQLLCLGKRHGFAFAIREALRLVKTTFVLVVQHDRMFLRPGRLPNVLEVMRRDPALKHVGLLQKSTLTYARTVNDKYGIDVGPYVRRAPDVQLTFVPAVFMYDSTHVARAQWYREFVFGNIVTSRGTFRLRTGDFIEDKLGQSMLSEIKALGMPAHALFGSFLLLEDGVGSEIPVVYHLDGRDPAWSDAPLVSGNGNVQYQLQEPRLEDLQQRFGWGVATAEGLRA